MAKYRVTGPDGASYDVTAPEGVSEAQVMAYVRSNAGAGPKAKTTAAGAFTRGVADGATVGLLPKIAAAANALIPGDPRGDDIYHKSLGEAYSNSLKRSRAMLAVDSRDHPVATTLGEVTGGTAVPMGEANTLARVAMQGGAYGAAYGFNSSDGTIGEKAKAAATGALSGAAGAGVGRTAIRGAGRVLAPATRPAVRALADAGVTMTPGQIIGGAAQRIEDKLQSVPIVGDAISSARRAGLDQFNRATVNRALKPIGETLPKNAPTGHDAIGYAEDKLSQRYQALLPKLTATPDRWLQAQLGRIATDVRSLPTQRQQQFMTIIKDKLVGPLNSGGGEGIKKAEAELGRLASDYKSSADADQRALGAAVEKSRDALRAMLLRQNPGEARQLKAINEGWANLVRIQGAAKATADGVFTPGQLRTAVRVADKSVRKRLSARGEAMMQDLASNAAQVLPSQVPNSGTTDRALLAAAAGGGAAYLGPGPVMATAAATVPYLPPARKAVQAALIERPAAVRRAGEKVGQVAPVGARIGATLSALLSRGVLPIAIATDRGQ